MDSTARQRGARTELNSIASQPYPNTETQSNGIHLFLKGTWNILQYRPQVRPQNRYYYLEMIEIIQAIDHNGKKSEITNNRNLETHIYVELDRYSWIVSGSKEEPQRE